MTIRPAKSRCRQTRRPPKWVLAGTFPMEPFRFRDAGSKTVPRSRSCGNGRLRRAWFDSVTKPAECLDHFSGALLLGRFSDLWASFLVADSSVQYLPDQATKFVSNYSDSLIVP